MVGQAIVTILPTDTSFLSQDCGSWSPLSPSGQLAEGFENGVFAVGTEIAAGTYHTAGSQGVLSESGGSVCVWERLNAFTGDPGAVIASDNPSGPTTVTIEPSDRGFESQGCQAWTKS